MELSWSMRQAMSLRPQHLKIRKGKKEKGSEENKILFCEDSQENEITSHGLVGSLFV